MNGGEPSKALPTYKRLWKIIVLYLEHLKMEPHVFMTGLFITFPITRVNALYERKSFIYVETSCGYWVF